VDTRARVNAVAIDLDALGDTRRLWEDWRLDAARRFRIDRASLETELPSWEHLLERFAEERAPVYLRPDAAVSSVLRELHAGGVRLGVFTDAPASLARVALAHVGASRRVTELEAGPGALERLRERLGQGTRVVRTREELLGLR
jgi:phosphoglycolate phosphatase-like HAD superfamily hydrolase